MTSNCCEINNIIISLLYQDRSVQWCSWTHLMKKLSRKKYAEIILLMSCTPLCQYIGKHEVNRFKVLFHYVIQLMWIMSDRFPWTTLLPLQHHQACWDFMWPLFWENDMWFLYVNYTIYNASLCVVYYLDLRIAYLVSVFFINFFAINCVLWILKVVCLVYFYKTLYWTPHVIPIEKIYLKKLSGSKAAGKVYILKSLVSFSLHVQLRWYLCGTNKWPLTEWDAY